MTHYRQINRTQINQIVIFFGCAINTDCFVPQKSPGLKYTMEIINEGSYCKTQYVIQVSNPRWPPREGYDMSWVQGGGGYSTSIPRYWVLASLLRRIQSGKGL